MEIRNKATEEKPQPESNQSVLSSTTWLWNPFSYLWGNSSPPTEAVAGELSSHTNTQKEADGFAPVILQGTHLLPLQDLTEQQHAVRPAEEQKQLEEILVQQEATAISSLNMSNLVGLLEPLNSMATANPSDTTPNVLPDNADHTAVSFVFKPIPPSPAAAPADPHPAQDTAEEDAAIARATELSISVPKLIPLAVTFFDTGGTMEKTNTDDEEEATSASIEIDDQKTTKETAVQQSLIAQIAKLQSDNMRLEQQLEQLRQENARKLEEDQKRLQKEKEEELERLRKNLEAQEATRQQEEEKQKAEKILRESKEKQRVIEEKARQEAAILLQREQEQRRAEAQATEERRKAEEAFSRSCSTGECTPEKHYQALKAVLARTGF